MMTKQEAQSAADAAALSMPGWTTHVWENGGWHWNLIKEVGNLRWNLSYSSKTDTWECYSYGSKGNQVWTSRYPTPQAAVEAASAALAAYIKNAAHDIFVLTGVEL